MRSRTLLWILPLTLLLIVGCSSSAQMTDSSASGQTAKQQAENAY